MIPPSTELTVKPVSGLKTAPSFAHPKVCQKICGLGDYDLEVPRSVCGSAQIGRDLQGKQWIKDKVAGGDHGIQFAGVAGGGIGRKDATGRTVPLDVGFGARNGAGNGQSPTANLGGALPEGKVDDEVAGSLYTEGSRTREAVKKHPSGKVEIDGGLARPTYRPAEGIGEGDIRGRETGGGIGIGEIIRCGST